jgi:hypothetical protein
MKKLLKKRILILLAVLILLPVCVQATSIDFYTDGQITDSNYFDVVQVWGTATVNMSGGQVLDFYTYQTSTVNLSSGNVSHFYIQGTSQLNVSGNGWILYTLEVSGSSIVNFTGGETHGFQGINASDFSIVNIYGYNLHISNNIVIGDWADNHPFRIGLAGSETASHIVLHEIPEPLSILFFSLTGLFIVKRSR